jgi:hypothetical protein
MQAREVGHDKREALALRLRISGYVLKELHLFEIVDLYSPFLLGQFRKGFRHAVAPVMYSILRL